MPASGTRIFFMTVILAATTSLMAQTRNGRTSRRNPPPPARETVDATPAPDTVPVPVPRDSESAPRPGTVTPPNGGYYVNPEPIPPGTAGNVIIPSDPLDRAYWEMYDREKSITLNGKVTRVDWTMPNSYIYLVADGALWAIESSFIYFRQSSVTPAINVHDTITVTAYFPSEVPWGELPARIAPPIAAYLKTNHLVRAGEITTGFGQKLLLGRPPTEKEMAERLKCSPFGC